MTAEEQTFEQILERDGSFCWKNTGCSMQPLIREGKEIIVIRKRPEGRLKKYDAVLFRRPGAAGPGTYILHRVYRVDPDGTYRIAGDNCSYTETVKEEDVIGVLSAVYRNGKTIRADSLPYRLYSRLSCYLYPLRCLRFRLLTDAHNIRHHLLK